MSYSATVLSLCMSASKRLLITKRKHNRNINVNYSGCFFLLCALRALLEPNFLSHLEQGSSRWYLRLCLLKTLAFRKSFLHTLQVRVTSFTICIFALCSCSRSAPTKVFLHSIHKFSFGMRWGLPLCLAIMCWFSLTFVKKILSQRLQGNIFAVRVWYLW